MLRLLKPICELFSDVFTPGIAENLSSNCLDLHFRLWRLLFKVFEVILAEIFTFFGVEYFLCPIHPASKIMEPVQSFIDCEGLETNKLLLLPNRLGSHAKMGLTNLTKSKAIRAFGPEAPIISKYSEGRRFPPLPGTIRFMISLRVYREERPWVPPPSSSNQ